MKYGDTTLACEVADGLLGEGKEFGCAGNSQKAIYRLTHDRSPSGAGVPTASEGLKNPKRDSDDFPANSNMRDLAGCNKLVCSCSSYLRFATELLNSQ
jgi:hypothetical protein